MVTVASAASSSDAMGRPTMVLRPTTTACAPLVSIPLRISIWITPHGVQGRSAVGSPITSFSAAAL